MFLEYVFSGIMHEQVLHSDGVGMRQAAALESTFQINNWKLLQQEHEGRDDEDV